MPNWQRLTCPIGSDRLRLKRKKRKTDFGNKFQAIVEEVSEVGDKSVVEDRI